MVRNLNQFPTEKIIDWGTDKAKKLKGDADQMFQKAVAINSNNIPTRTARTVLTPGVLPVPDNAGPSQMNFRNAYDDLMRPFQAQQARAGVAGPVGAPAATGTPEAVQPPGKMVEMLKATRPVSPEEIKAEHDKIVEDVKSHEQKAGDQVINQPALDDELAHAHCFARTWHAS